MTWVRAAAPPSRPGCKSGTLLKCPLQRKTRQMAERLLTHSFSSPCQISWSVRFRSLHPFGIFSGLLGVSVWTLRRSRRSATSVSSTRPRWRLWPRSGYRYSQVRSPEAASSISDIWRMIFLRKSWFSSGFLGSEDTFWRGGYFWAVLLRGWYTSVKWLTLTSVPALPVRSCDLAFISIMQCDLPSKVTTFSE